MFVSCIFYAHSSETSANRVDEGLIFPATLLFENNGVRKSPICSRRGIRREIRYRAVRDSFPQTRKPRYRHRRRRRRRRRIPAKLLPTGKLSDLSLPMPGVRDCLEIGIVEKRWQKGEKCNYLVSRRETEVSRNCVNVTTEREFSWA